MSRRDAQPRKKKRDEESDDDSDEAEDGERLPSFVPEEGIDIEPLAGYVRGLLDRQARVRIGNHPARRDQKGFWVESIVPITMEDIRAMIEDTKMWQREKSSGYYVNSQTMKRRRQLGRPQAARERPMAIAKTQKEPEESRIQRQSIRQSVEQDSRYLPPPTLGRVSADNVPMARAGSMVSPSPRPATVQPIQGDPRRPSNTSQYGSNINPGYVQATAQYTVSANIPQTQYASYDTSMYDTAPPPYSNDNKRGGGGGGGGGNQPSTTGSQGFQSLYATSGGPPRQAPNQGQRRHDNR